MRAMMLISEALEDTLQGRALGLLKSQFESQTALQQE